MEHLSKIESRSRPCYKKENQLYSRSVSLNIKKNQNRAHFCRRWSNKIWPQAVISQIIASTKPFGGINLSFETIMRNMQLVVFVRIELEHWWESIIFALCGNVDLVGFRRNEWTQDYSFSKNFERRVMSIDTTMRNAKKLILIIEQS